MRGVIQHAELRLGDGLVMFGQTDNTAAEPCNRHSIYVAIANPDEHCARQGGGRRDHTRAHRPAIRLTGVRCSRLRGQCVVVWHLQAA